MSQQVPPPRQPHLWEQSYPDDIIWDSKIAPCAMPELMKNAEQLYGDRPAIDFMGRIYLYKEISTLVNKVAKGLQNEGLKKGMHVGLMLPNCPAMVISYYAILRAGGTVVNFNPLYAEEEIAAQVEDSQVDIMFTLDIPLIYSKAFKMLKSTRLQKIILCSMAEQLPPVKSILYKLLRGKDIVKPPKNNSHILFKNLISNNGAPDPVNIIPEQDIAVLQYTGGTTGKPKGAMLTHANLTANVQQALYCFPKTELGNEIVMGVLPLFHVFAMTVVMNFSVHTGAKMILLPRFELQSMLKALSRTRPTLFPAVPTIYIAINNDTGVARGKYDLSSIRYCLAGGDTLPRDVQEKFESISGCRLIEGYGLSETSPIAVCNPSTGESRAGSIGLPAPQTIVEITDIEEPSKVLKQGETGEICLSGPQVMLGYWDQEEETKLALQDGRFHTGDVGYMDEDGYTYLIDRLKEVIIAGGYNVYPRHVEDAIYRHPAVEEATVVGVDDEYRQQTVKAFVKLRSDQDLKENDLLEFLKDKLSKIEMPKQIEFREELPKTLIGKLSKKELIAEELKKREKSIDSPVQ